MQAPITVSLTVPSVNGQNIRELNEATAEYKNRVDEIIQGKTHEQDTDKLQSAEDSKISVTKSKNPVLGTADKRQVNSAHYNQNLSTNTNDSIDSGESLKNNSVPVSLSLTKISDETKSDANITSSKTSTIPVTVKPILGESKLNVSLFGDKSANAAENNRIALELLKKSNFNKSNKNNKKK